MIKIWISKPLFAYDIQALTKAFFPKEEVVVSEEKSFRLEEDSLRLEIHYVEKNEGMEIQVELIEREIRKKKTEIGITQNSTLETRGSHRNALKKALYLVLSDYTKKELPWGTLTGIRPTKIPMYAIQDHKVFSKEMEEELVSQLKEIYLMSETKARLSIEITKRELTLLNKTHRMEGYSVYIGIPFCPTTCLYCSFTSYPLKRYENRIDDYLEAMEKELRFIAVLQKGKPLDSVYIGGGTPTTLNETQLERLLCSVREILDFSNVLEFNLEAGRPDSITREKLLLMKKYGVTRISVNPQTMHQKTLDLIGRKHSVEQVKEAFYLAREVGFDNINMDLILGLPGETDADVSVTLNEIKKLAPDSLTIHSLAIKRASRLREVLEEKGVEPIHNTKDTMMLAEQAAREMGLSPYYLYRQKNMAGNLENVGYAKDTKYGIYNVLIMEEVQSILAVGAGTVSKFVASGNVIKRCDCVKDVDIYIDKIDDMIERKRKLFT
jgi:oxygen-independent coproporphyrinogen-3 oxidase